MKEQTFIILKPDAVQKGIVDLCLKRFENAGLIVKKKWRLKLNKKFVDELYRHIENVVSPRLLENIKTWMLSDYVVAAILEGKNAIEKTRKICGNTNPAEAKKGTLRGDFSQDDIRVNSELEKETHNIVHATGSKQEAEKEIKLFRKFVLGK